MEFRQTDGTRWESNKQAYSAVAFNENREPVGILEPQFTIVKGELKGKTVYRLYEQHIGRKEQIGRFKTLEQAMKGAQK